MRNERHHRPWKLSALPLLALAALPLLGIAGMAASAEELSWTADFRVGGCGGAYFLAEPGEFWVEVEKQDLNRRGRKTHVRAILFAPDRTVVAEETLPWTGQEKGSGPGPVQRVRLSVKVPRAGVYGLNITASEDRYGQEIAWGLRTNCPKYLVETSRGHKDERHQEPLVLMQGDAAGAVCFLPRTEAFTIDASGFRGETLRLLDAEGTALATIPVDDEGVASLKVPVDIPRDKAPWQLAMSGANGTINIDGVTRWEGVDRGNQDLSLWSPRAETWFPLHENRWLLTPYRIRRNVKEMDKGTVSFDVHNNGTATKTVTLSVAQATGTALMAAVTPDTVTVAPGKAVPVTVIYTANAEACDLAITATTADGFTTYATLALAPGSDAVGQSLDLPLVLKPYHHENAQFGYAPDYPVTNEVYFDHKNRPAITSRSGVSVWREGTWNHHERGGRLSSKVAFDDDNNLYLVALRDGQWLLERSTDGGISFDSHPIAGGSYDIEQFSGHNRPQGVPPLARFKRTASDPNRIWRRIHDLELYLPTVAADGGIDIGKPILVSDKCIGLSSHSGIPSTIVSRDDKVHIVWAEATDPELKVPGVPTFVATWDRTSETLSEPVLVGYGPPANDIHNTPSITMDSQGHLHVLVGTHGRTFLYARSLKPNDASGGFTEPEALGPGLRQTYVGFVCDADDALHVVFRLWNTDTTYFPASHYATLSYMRKKPGEEWSEPRPLIVPPFSEYSVFYHRLSIDRSGALFLSYDYWSTYWFYRTDRRGTRRALMTSPDGGDTWRLVDNALWRAP